MKIKIFSKDKKTMIIHITIHWPFHLLRFLLLLYGRSQILLTNYDCLNLIFKIYLLDLQKIPFDN